jgi:hypothetical protein
VPLVENVFTAAGLGAFCAFFWANPAMAVNSRNAVANTAILFIQFLLSQTCEMPRQNIVRKIPAAGLSRD